MSASTLLTFLSTIGFPQAVILVLVVFFCFLIYSKATQGDYYSKLYDIKEHKRAEMWSFVQQELTQIEAKSLSRTNEIIKTLDCNHHITYNLFRFALERSMGILFESLKTNIRNNGYHSKTGAELDQYINDLAISLLDRSRLLISERVPELNGTEAMRFTVDDAKLYTRKIILKSIEIRKEEDIAIEKLKIKYSLLAKIKSILPKQKS